MNNLWEFFAGGGLARIGLGPSWRCTFANDIDAQKGAVYRNNFGTGELKVCDVAKLTTADLPGRAALAWASFPCQDLSLAGDRGGLDAKRSGALWPFLLLMGALRREHRAPGIIVLENVPGLLTSREGRDFAALVGALADLGYSVGAVTLDAVDFLPQSRKRVFVVAIDAPTASLSLNNSQGSIDKDVTRSARQLSLEARESWINIALPPAPPRSVTLGDLIEDAPRDTPWHSSAETNRLIALMAPAHVVKLDTARASGRRQCGTIFRTMRPGTDGVDKAGTRTQRAEIRLDGIAGCLRVPSGGSSRQTIMLIDGDRVRSRLLSGREAARLMGLSDSYKLPSDLNGALHLCGDAVAVPVVAWLAQHVLDPVANALPKIGVDQHEIV
jgi:DNA (cytosine-5)-methyltransferase 1